MNIYPFFLNSKLQKRFGQKFIKTIFFFNASKKFNSFYATGLCLCPMKISENLWFFREYKKRSLVRNGLRRLHREGLHKILLETTARWQEKSLTSTIL